MGYSSKRRRSKRRRTRTLNAIHSLNSPDDSSLDHFEQCSSYASFCSAQSHISHTNSNSCNILPNSIFVDDLNCHNFDKQDPSNVYHSVDNTEDQFSAIEVDDVDHLFNYPEAPLDDMSNTEDITIESIPSSSMDHYDDNSHHRSNNQHHRFDQMTRDEIASYKIMSLLDTAGAPRICYNRLVALLKKLSKHQGFDVKKAVNRETLMKRLEGRYQTRPRIQSTVLNHQVVFRFTFQDMLQDLLYSSSKYLHEILPRHEHEIPVAGTEHELWNTTWMRNTFGTQPYKDFNPKNDIMLPIILYMDKTGTDVNQRYSLEPVLFSVAAITRERRESRHSWRHLGFVPQKQRCSDEETSSDLQFYHDCMSYLLDGLKEAQKNPPTVAVKLSHGGKTVVQRKAFLPLMIVMGDQLSQDTLCGRLKSNSGGAGRVHRSCMCSYLHVDNPFHHCKKVDTTTLNMLTTYATTSDDDIASKIDSISSSKEVRNAKTFLLKRRTMFRSILRHPFTTHSIKNAFEGIDFGSWSSGIHDATFDDFMHSVEAGMISYITETVYDGLTKKEKETVEELTRPMLDNQRCSVISNYPRWRLQPGFTRQTLMTSGERVGSMLALCLSLQDPNIRETIRLGHCRQTAKYLDLSMEFPAETKSRETEQEDETVVQMKKPPPPCPTPQFYLDQHMHTLDDQRIRHTLEHMIRHGFLIDLIDDLDPFQINQMLWHCADIFKNIQYPDNYPMGTIDDVYVDLGKQVHISKEHFHLVKYSLQTKPYKLLKNERHRRVEGATGKHLKKKANKKGEGSSAAVLTNNMGTLVVFLEYVLCYHAFCKYSWTLPVFLQRHYENIQSGNRFVVEYFQKLIYRGNCTVDSRFPKIHSQCRMGDNTVALNTVMNVCCETGERLLKTEAKGISRTAQQRGDLTFITQTMSRLQDRLVLDGFAVYLEEGESTDIRHQSESTDQLGRIHPHFLYEVETGRFHALNRNNEPKIPDDKSGYLDKEVLYALKEKEPSMTQFEIYNEVILRDNSRLRASPNYANSGPWYDYVNVSWERTANGVVETYLLPAKCLCFFRKVCPDSGNVEIMSLIQSVDPLSKGKIAGRMDTLLTCNYRMEFDNKGRPKTHVVPVASIDSSIRCFSHVPSTHLFNANSPGITYLLPRNHWAYMWMAMNDALKESNSTAKVKQRKGKLNPLCSQLWLENVRERYHQFLHATCMEDLP